jgi:hypothetical protein
MALLGTSLPLHYHSWTLSYAYGACHSRMPNCEVVVHAPVEGTVQERAADDGGPWLVSLAQCPKCGGALVGIQEASGGYEDGAPFWTEPDRVWPSPPASLSWQIPSEIRDALQEAHQCLKCKAYTASVGMSGRALEAVGRHFNPNETKPPMLGAGLQKLYDAKVIDSHLYE